MQIIPTVFEKEFEAAEKRIKRFGETTKWIQIDVIDGIFGQGKSFGLELLNKIEGEYLWDVHLMVKEPINWVEKSIFVGASRIIGQMEMMEDKDGFVKRVKDEGMEAGLGFDIETKVENIPAETDVVLLMGRKAGFEERPLDERVYEKIKKIKEMGFMVGVDGGVTLQNLEKLKNLGVDIIYTGFYYFDLISAGKNK